MPGLAFLPHPLPDLLVEEIARRFRVIGDCRHLAAGCDAGGIVRRHVRIAVDELVAFLDEKPVLAFASLCPLEAHEGPAAVQAPAVQAERRAILTLDKGIANVQRYPPQDYAGIVLFRPPAAGRGVVLDFVRRRLGATLPLLVAGALIVVSERSIRVR